MTACPRILFFPVPIHHETCQVHLTKGHWVIQLQVCLFRLGGGWMGHEQMQEPEPLLAWSIKAMYEAYPWGKLCCWLARPTTLTLPCLYHIIRERAAAIGYITKDQSFVHTYIHTLTHTHTHTHTHMYAHTHTANTFMHILHYTYAIIPPTSCSNIFLENY